MNNDIINYRRFLEGDDEGLTKIVEFYSDGLVAFINQIVEDEGAAEDIMEDAFAELIFKRNRFREEASLKTYLYKIGRNKAINYLKKHSRISLTDMNELPEMKKSVNIDNPEMLIIKKEQQQEVHRAIQQLNRQYRQVLYLLYFEEMSYEEIGNVMKKSNQQVKNLAYRSRLSLKKILEKGEFVYEEL